MEKTEKEPPLKVRTGKPMTTTCKSMMKSHYHLKVRAGKPMTTTAI